MNNPNMHNYDNEVFFKVKNPNIRTKSEFLAALNPVTGVDMW